MKNNILVVVSVLLVISIGTYFSIISDGTVRTVEFVSIFAIGMLAGVLLTQLFKRRVE